MPLRITSYNVCYTKLLRSPLTLNLIKVAKGDIIEVEKLEVEAGKVIDITEVLLVGEGSSVKVGAPLVAGANVKAEVLNQKKGDKVIIFKKKRRHNYRRTRGHRQNLTVSYNFV